MLRRGSEEPWLQHSAHDFCAPWHAALCCAQDTNRLSGGTYTGAATYSFIQAIERYGANQSYGQLLSHMYAVLHKQVGLWHVLLPAHAHALQQGRAACGVGWSEC